MQQPLNVSNEEHKIKNNNLEEVPELRFPEFKELWQKNNLENIAYINKGFTPSTSKKEYWENGEFNWLSIADMGNKYLNYSKKKITRKGTKNKLPIPPNTLVMSFKLSIGKLGILNKPMYTNEAIVNFNWKTNEFDTEFMYYYLSSINILKYGSQAAKGITLNNETLNSIPIIHPSIQEQKKIVSFLSLIDKKLTLLEKTLFLYQKLEEKIRRDIFNFKENLIDFEKHTLEDIADIRKGFTPSTQNEEYWENGTYKWLSIADMNKKYLSESSKKITEEAIKHKNIIPKDTLIMSFKLSIGKLAILKEPMFTNEAIANFTWKTKDISTEYTYYYLKTINVLKYGSQAAKGVTLNNDSLNSIPILLPSYEKQNEIVKLLKVFEMKLELINLELEKGNEFKKGIMQKMFV